LEPVLNRKELYTGGKHDEDEMSLQSQVVEINRPALVDHHGGKHY
jgi:hypothetical protein